MKFIRYFFYIALNWNLRIAWHLLQQEIKGEKKYGINTTGADELQSLEKQDIDIEHATIYMPSPYGLLEWAFQKVDMGSYKHIVDIGSGKGRALCVAAHFGATKLTGVDFSKSSPNKNSPTFNTPFLPMMHFIFPFRPMWTASFSSTLLTT